MSGRTPGVLDAQKPLVLQSTRREMVSRVYTFFVTLGDKDLWNCSEELIGFWQVLGWGEVGRDSG